MHSQKCLEGYGAIDDLKEIFKNKNNGVLDTDEMSYYCTRIFLNSYRLQLKRCNGYGYSYAAEDNIKELLRENEENYNNSINNKGRDDDSDDGRY